MIKTLSTYKLTVPFTNPTTSVIATSYTVKLFVWAGDKLAVPLLPIYLITKPNPTLSNGQDIIDISRLINDFIDFDFEYPNVINGIENTNVAVWAKWEISYSDTPTVPSITATNLCVKGYGFTSEGVNPQLPIDGVLVDNDEHKIPYDGIYILPVKVSETIFFAYLVKSFPSQTILNQGNLIATTDSNELIRNIIIKPTPATSQDKYITIAMSNGVTKTLLYETECKYDPLQIVFQNRNGVSELMTFFKAKKESISVTKEMYENDIFYQYNVNSKSKFEINSGWISEDKNENIKQLLLSEKTYALVNGQAIPILVETKSLDFKTRVNDKLINYKIDFSYAANDIS